MFSYDFINTCISLFEKRNSFSFAMIYGEIGIIIPLVVDVQTRAVYFWSNLGIRKVLEILTGSYRHAIKTLKIHLSKTGLKLGVPFTPTI